MIQLLRRRKLLFSLLHAFKEINNLCFQEFFYLRYEAKR